MFNEKPKHKNDNLKDDQHQPIWMSRMFQLTIIVIIILVVIICILALVHPTIGNIFQNIPCACSFYTLP